MKLGKLAVRHDPRTLKLAKYLPTLPTPPPVCDWGSKVSFWNMLANDSVGDCTCASAGHMLMAWTSSDATEFVPTDAQILSAYSEITGYDPKTGMNDNGAVELDVLKYWRNKGIAGKKILAYVKIEEKNFNQLKTSGWLFGGVYIGVSLPVEAQNQKIWDVTPGEVPGSWGGHAVPVIGYNAAGPVVVTWGEKKQMTWPAYFAWCDEAYAILSGDWTGPDNLTPNGFDMVQLVSDLKELDGASSVEKPDLWERIKTWLKDLF